MRFIALILNCCCCAFAATHHQCQVRPTNFEGWKAEELSNDWVRLAIVPQLGGRLMQVTFAGHSYLFVNPQYKGKYFPPSNKNNGKWFNYGGDKIWPLPEGRQDEQHWAGPASDVLDDGEYQLKILSQDNICAVRLDGPADPVTGLQYSREISISGDSPQISFHAVMKNASSRPIRWSVQSVTQYDTAASGGGFNRDFWAFTPVNPQSAYFNGYQVRAGLADDPSFAVDGGLFTLHWQYLENEVWLDSTAGWLAVTDNSTHYAMIERFQYFSGADYPGKASVIFYKNGAALELDNHDLPAIRSSTREESPYYMEAEINSPMIRLTPGESYAMDTQWFPTRAGKDLKGVTDTGIIEHPLAAHSTMKGLRISGWFGVFYPGKLVAHLYDVHGVQLQTIPLQSVDPARAVELHEELEVPQAAERVSIHLIDEGKDHGSLGESKIAHIN
ncbi:MAG: hypothetical protein DMG88_03760 [Acidobacteria bacterium]|nr:MAG: hypothetical protein DMG88_03760 [Acidobacteriota bacterium]